MAQLLATGDADRLPFFCLGEDEGEDLSWVEWQGDLAGRFDVNAAEVDGGGFDSLTFGCGEVVCGFECGADSGCGGFAVLPGEVDVKAASGSEAAEVAFWPC